MNCYEIFFQKYDERIKRMKSNKEFCFAWLTERLKDPKENPDYWLDQWLEYREHYKNN